MCIKRAIALFGESEKGHFGNPCLIKSILHLNDAFGNPPEESRGIFLAIQFLTSKQPLFYIRVEEEGFSVQDYSKGVQSICSKQSHLQWEAVCMPGVGDTHIIHFVQPLIKKWDAILITTQRDLYDYLTSLYSPNC